MKFTEHSSKPKSEISEAEKKAYDLRRAKAPASNNYRAKAEIWGEEACDSMRKACDPNVIGQALEYHRTHSVRAARFAFYFAARAKKYRYWDRLYLEKVGKPLDSL